MDLASISVGGYRRFKSDVHLKTNGKLVALLGPNEAGKSSLLNAIALLGNDTAPSTGDFSRGGNRSEFYIEGRFYLDASEVEAAGLTGQHWLIIRKAQDGVRSYSTAPAPPRRDTSSRLSLMNGIETALSNEKFLSEFTSEEADRLSSELENINDILSRDDEDLPNEDIAFIEEIGELFLSHSEKGPTAAIRKLPTLFEKFSDAEDCPNPSEAAIRVLKKMVPNVIFFDEASRDLRADYDLEKLQNGIPDALRNILSIANVDAERMIAVMEEGNAADISTIEHAANAALRDGFKPYWKQSKIDVSIRLQAETIAVQVVNEKSEFTSFAERSDGLRQYIALLAFSGSGLDGNPIMLIDEAEQRLHYDAQADLVQMLARQQVASKVIYTTHSAGCLPEDMGNGVRLVKAHTSDATGSEIKNKFWADNDPGIAPLLYGMGAGTLAFFPTRNAVVVEGPSDMLLLPTMMREAMGSDVLGFQFVPGLSYADGPLHAPAIGKAVGILYLVDVDDGGKTIQKALIKSGIDQASIFQIGSGSVLEVEDYIDPGVLIEAANKLIEKFHPKASVLNKSKLTARGRMNSLEIAFASSTKSKLPKVELAYEILDIINDDPGRKILDPKRAANLGDLAKAIEKRFREKAVV